MPNPYSPKFPNFLEHHKPFPSNKRGAHRAGCVIILKGVCNNIKKKKGSSQQKHHFHHLFSYNQIHQSHYAASTLTAPFSEKEENRRKIVKNLNSAQKSLEKWS